MPLSEHEQQLLAQLEKQLHEEDPRFASSMHSETVRTRGSMRNLVVGVVLAVVGLGVLLAGVATHLIVVGVLGFAIMAGGTYLATTRNRTAPGAAGASSGAQPRASSRPGKSSTFLQNLEQRWDDRNRGGH